VSAISFSQDQAENSFEAALALGLNRGDPLATIQAVQPAPACRAGAMGWCRRG
jgi:hypothetical protein